MRCLHCGKRLSLLRKLSDPEFCCTAHREAYQKQQNDLAFARLVESGIRQPPQGARSMATRHRAEPPARAGFLPQRAGPAAVYWKPAGAGAGPAVVWDLQAVRALLSPAPLRLGTAHLLGMEEGAPVPPRSWCSLTAEPASIAPPAGIESAKPTPPPRLPSPAIQIVVRLAFPCTEPLPGGREIHCGMPPAGGVPGWVAERPRLRFRAVLEIERTRPAAARPAGQEGGGIPRRLADPRPLVPPPPPAIIPAWLGAGARPLRFLARRQGALAPASPRPCALLPVARLGAVRGERRASCPVAALSGAPGRDLALPEFRPPRTGVRLPALGGPAAIVCRAGHSSPVGLPAPAADPGMAAPLERARWLAGPGHAVAMPAALSPRPCGAFCRVEPPLPARAGHAARQPCAVARPVFQGGAPVLPQAPPALLPHLGYALPAPLSWQAGPVSGAPAILRRAGGRVLAWHRNPAMPTLRMAPGAPVPAPAEAEQAPPPPPLLFRQIQPSAQRPVRHPASWAIQVPAGGWGPPVAARPATGGAMLRLELEEEWPSPSRGATSRRVPAPAALALRQHNAGRAILSRLRIPRKLAWLGVAAVVLAAAYSFVARQTNDKAGPASVAASPGGGPAAPNWIERVLSERAAIRHFDDFRSGLGAWQGVEGWSKTWNYSDSTMLEPGLLALYSPTLNMSDYSMEFLGQIERRSLSWAVRAENLSNYYALRIVITRGGAAPGGVLQRYPVTAGRPGAVQSLPLPPNLSLQPGRLLRVRTDVAGRQFTVRVQGQVVDSFTVSSHPRGGVGFFNQKGDRSMLRWVEVMHQYDYLGRFCALFVSGRQPAEGR